MSHEANNAGAESGVLSASNTEGEAANAAATHRASPEPIVDELEEWEKVEAPAQVVAPIADLTPARQLHAAGFKLCALHPNSKRPVGLAWNNPANCVSTFDESLTGYGFPLNINGRCSIDPDEVTMAKVTIAAWGFDLDEIMAAGVRTNSTRPGSGGRSQFTTVDGLGWVTFRTKVDGKNVTVLELRASSDNLQDVIPGLLYADITGAIRTQAYANGKTFLDAPPPPADFTSFWKRMSSDMAFRAQMEDKADAALREAGYIVDLIRDLSDTGAGNLPFGDVDKRLRAKFNAATDVEAILLKHGYTCPRKQRWSSPNSTGEPGIRLIKGHDTLWQSSHGSDPLRGTFDAAAASIVLDFAYDEDAFEAYVRASAAKLDFAEELGAGNSGPTVEEVAAAVAEVEAVSADVDPRWNFKPLDMAKVMRDDPKPIKWLFHQRVPGNRGALLTGLGGTSKTQMLYQMAIAAILGTCPWGWNVDATGKAILILTEDDENDPHITLHTIKMAMGLGAEQSRAIAENLIVFPLAGQDLKLMIRDPDSGALVGSCYLKALEEMIDRTGNVAFVGIDPALGVTDGDEASQSDQRALGRMADNLAVRCSCTVFILTHGTKGSLQSDELTSHSSRGGGAITDAVRAEYGMRTMTIKEAQKFGVADIAERESYVQLKATKGNRIPPEAKVPVWFRRSKGGYLEVVELVEAQRSGISPSSQRALDLLTEMDPDNNGVRLQDWRKRCIDDGLISGPTEEALKKAMGRTLKSIGNRIKKKEGERGIYQRNFANFDESDDEHEDAA